MHCIEGGTRKMLAVKGRTEKLSFGFCSGRSSDNISTVHTSYTTFLPDTD